MATTPGFAGKRRIRSFRKASKEKSEEDKEIVSYRRHWENCYGKYFGSFEDTSKLIQSSQFFPKRNPVPIFN